MSGTPLDHDSISRMIDGSPPLLEGFLSLETQLQPNGFDMSIREVSRFTSPGSMGAADLSLIHN